MKMEVIGWHELLTAYMKQQYAGKDVLVIFQDDLDSAAEYNSLMNDLDMMSLAPPHAYRGSGYLIIEMEVCVARDFIEKHNGWSIRIELFSDGESVCENLCIR